MCASAWGWSARGTALRSEWRSPRAPGGSASFRADVGGFDAPRDRTLVALHLHHRRYARRRRDRHVSRVPRPRLSRRVRRLARRLQESRRRSTSAARRRRTGIRPSGSPICRATAWWARCSSRTPSRRSTPRRSTSRRRRSPRSTSTRSRARARTTAGWRTSAPRRPQRRAGIGLIHLNDLDDAIEDVKWIAENGLRGGVLLPLPSPAEHWLKPLNHPELRPALGRDPGPRPRDEPALGSGLAALSGGAGLDAALGARDDVLRPARLHPPDHGRRVRALPEAHATS